MWKYLTTRFPLPLPRFTARRVFKQMWTYCSPVEAKQSQRTFFTTSTFCVLLRVHVIWRLSVTSGNLFSTSHLSNPSPFPPRKTDTHNAPVPERNITFSFIICSTFLLFSTNYFGSAFINIGSSAPKLCSVNGVKFNSWIFSAHEINRSEAL